jgi:hypothetical protein
MICPLIEHPKEISMKKSIPLLSVLLCTIGLYAGGNTASRLPAVATIKAPCKANYVYIEKEQKRMWQDQPYSSDEDGAYAREQSLLKVGTLAHAQNYCRQLNYAGYTDWRLPSSDELMHVHRRKGEQFVYQRAEDFWTKTPTTNHKFYVVSPVDAYQYKRSPKQSNYIRCVRCTTEKFFKSGSKIVE